MFISPISSSNKGPNEDEIGSGGYLPIERKSVSAQSNYSKTTGMAIRMSAAEAPASIVKAPGLTTQPWLSLS